ncbi:MAG: 50S ribosomal protein L24e [Candidatus Diapherotrites archaeon]|uniref:50S ribosomal protein L24e n=1 Tax=Candidatus Iainarchaeum sp. TaxID=3101447 RepID=A0A938YV26_9ARCH|nr:50S ribosomal protein L24e [Candidatus Diapherotrites archaeon]
MAKCSFCGKTLTPGTGLLFVRKDATASFFCSSKCERNLLKLSRHSGITRWTETFHAAKRLEKQKEKQKEGQGQEKKKTKAKPKKRKKGKKRGKKKRPKKRKR